MPGRSSRGAKVSVTDTSRCNWNYPFASNPRQRPSQRIVLTLEQRLKQAKVPTPLWQLKVTANTNGKRYASLIRKVEGKDQTRLSIEVPKQQVSSFYSKNKKAFVLRSNEGFTVIPFDAEGQPGQPEFFRVTLEDTDSGFEMTRLSIYFMRAGSKMVCDLQRKGSLKKVEGESSRP